MVTPTRSESPCLWRSPRPVHADCANAGIHVPRFEGRDTGRAIDRTPPRRIVAKCNRERSVFWLSRHPLPYTSVTARFQRGYGFCEDGERVSTTYSPPRREPKWWAWNRPCRREATPSLPIDTLRDWLGLRHDAGLLDNVGCRGFVGFIPALKHGAFSLHSRNSPYTSDLSTIIHRSEEVRQEHLDIPGDSRLVTRPPPHVDARRPDGGRTASTHLIERRSKRSGSDAGAAVVAANACPRRERRLIRRSARRRRAVPCIACGW